MSSVQRVNIEFISQDKVICWRAVHPLQTVKALMAEGAGRVRLEPILNLTVDIFRTHLAADPDRFYGYNNGAFREKQIHQLLNKWA